MLKNRTTIEQIAEAALKREYFRLREITQEFLRENPRLSEVNRPNTNDPRVLAAAASLIELLAVRRNLAPPPWTKEIGSLSEVMYLVDPKEAGEYTLFLCETESPQPLRKRGFLAPPNFLDSR
jgi:hypothetical protein